MEVMQYNCFRMKGSLKNSQ